MEKEHATEYESNYAHKRKISVSTKIYLGTVVFIFILSVVYWILLRHELPRGVVELRMWLRQVGVAGIMVWQALIIIGTVLLCTRIFQKDDAKRSRYVGRILSILLCIITIGFSVFLWLGAVGAIDKETINENGTITVAHARFLDETEYSLWKPEGILYRRYLRVSAGPGDIDPSMTREMFIREHWPESYSNESGEPFTSSTEDKPTETEQIPDEQFIQSRIYDGLVAIYSQLAVDEQEYSYSYRQSYSTHGEPRAILYEDDKIIRFLQYDRISANNECFLYVYYEASMAKDGTWAATEAQILDMYAYVIDSGEVVASGKHSWSDFGSDIYREVSGE